MNSQTLLALQAKAAKELGVPRETISRWERGRMKIARPKMLELACRQLKTDEQFKETS